MKLLSNTSAYKKIYLFLRSLSAPVLSGILAALFVNSMTASRLDSIQDNLIKETIQNIYIGQSKEWIDYRLGPPNYTNTLNVECKVEDGYEQNMNYTYQVGIYITRYAMLRVYFDEENLSCQAFAVTIQKKNHQINLPEPYSEFVMHKSLGDFSYSEILYEPSYIASYHQNGTGRMAYIEEHFYTGTGGRGFYFGTMDYGASASQLWDDVFMQDYSDRKFKDAQFEFEDRTKAYPDTYMITDRKVPRAFVWTAIGYNDFDSEYLRKARPGFSNNE